MVYIESIFVMLNSFLNCSVFYSKIYCYIENISQIIIKIIENVNKYNYYKICINHNPAIIL